MIELKNVSFIYKESKKPAIQDVSAKVGNGLFLLAGENGAGKTTLLHLIAGLMHPLSGECLIDNVSSTSTNPDEMGKAFILEDNMYFPGNTIREFAKLHSRFYPDFSKGTFDENLKAFGQTGNEPLKSLSLGNLKKAQLAYVLALGTKVILLDEPTNALDIEGRETLRKLLTSVISENQTVIVSTHTVSELDKLFEGAMIMQKSKMLFAGTEEYVASRLAFEYSLDPDPEALFSENMAGRYLNIYPANDHDETNIDWKALYLALHSEKSQEIINQLKKQ